MDKLWFLSTGLVLLAWILSSCISRRRPPLVNYDSMVYFNRDIRHNPNGPLYLLSSKHHKHAHYADSNVFLPRSKDEIAWIVKSVAEAQRVSKRGGGRSRRIRVIGSGHSWSSIAKSDDIQISLENYKGLVSVDKDNMEVTVRAGTTLSELNSLLEERGLAMKVLGSISDQTVGGAISTATHGSGVGHGNIASLLTKLELITGEGETLILSPRRNQDIFKAAQVSLGLLGVISEVTIQCEPAFNLREIRQTIPLDECLDNLDNLVRGGQHVKYWIDIYTEKCAVFMANRTSDSPRDIPYHFIDSIKNYALEVSIHLSSWIPDTIPWLMKFIFGVLPDTLPPYDRIDKSYSVFNIPHYFPVHHESELILDIKDCAAAIREQRKFVFEKGIPLNYITEIRFVKSDDIWMSPNYERDSCHITLCIYNPTKEKRELYFFGLFKALSRFQPRVHWGKQFNIKRNELQTMYPKLGEFLAVNKRLDPYGIFWNELLQKSFEV